MKFLLFLFVTTFAAVTAVSFMDVVVEEWNLFKIKHNKSYESNTEEKFRMKIFMDNKHKIAKHNAKFETGEVNFKLGLNKYADMLHHEFITTLNGYKRSAKPMLKMGQKESSEFSFIPPANVEVPKHVDWRSKGAVTPVKDQGQCGSCWAFSSTGALEGQHFRKTGVLISLSEQNLIDCSGPEGNGGCSGGLMENAFQYVKDNGGIDTEQSYPYEAMNDSCRYTPRNSGASDRGYVKLPSGDEVALKKAVATVGPISIAIDAALSSFQLYQSGVYDDMDCLNAEDNLDHGVLVVGYGTDEDSGKDYWLVKNSWGPGWGEEGYIKMVRNSDNRCGIATDASYPLV